MASDIGIDPRELPVEDMTDNYKQLIQKHENLQKMRATFESAGWELLDSLLGAKEDSWVTAILRAKDFSDVEAKRNTIEVIRWIRRLPLETVALAELAAAELQEQGEDVDVAQ